MLSFLYVLVGVVLATAAVLARRRFAAFQGQSPEDYDGTGPDLDLKQYLSGSILCEGVIFGPAGRVTARFTADMVGTWDGDRGTLAETFHYDDGSTQERAWYIELGENGRITARADDVIGAGRGRQCGPAVQLKYDIRLPESSGGHILSVVDWMYLVDGKTLINRSQFRKFGIKVAELVATMRPVEKT